MLERYVMEESSSAEERFLARSIVESCNNTCNQQVAEMPRDKKAKIAACANNPNLSQIGTQSCGMTLLEKLPNLSSVNQPANERIHAK